MTTRRASCSCGQLSLVFAGEPVRVSMCHCLACQRRTGSVFGVQARFRREEITSIEGHSTQYVRTADSGSSVTFYFCPLCGATVYWELSALPGFVGVAVGAFADPSFPAPKISIYEERRHSWALPGDLEVEHLD